VSISPFSGPGVELHVLIDGIPLLETTATQIRHIRVESQLNLPAMCEVELSDPQQLMLEETGLVAGTMIEVRAVSGEDPIGVPLFIGQIESVEVRYDTVSGLRSIVRAYDQGHGLPDDDLLRGRGGHRAGARHRDPRDPQPRDVPDGRAVE
jgi:hypothetical protein